LPLRNKEGEQTKLKKEGNGQQLDALGNRQAKEKNHKFPIFEKYQ
jgi:hypothetical protein